MHGEGYPPVVEVRSQIRQERWFRVTFRYIAIHHTAACILVALGIDIIWANLFGSIFCQRKYDYFLNRLTFDTTNRHQFCIVFKGKASFTIQSKICHCGREDHFLFAIILTPYPI